jgi:hypothetical protein
VIIQSAAPPAYSWMVRHLPTETIRFYNVIVACQSREVGGGSTMGLLIGAGILSVCSLVTWLVLRRPVRQIVEDVRVDHARVLFHQQREWLEARFITALGQADSAEGRRWETAYWHDEVLWARDRKTRRLLALVCVHFEPHPFHLSLVQRHATALFEFCKGRWRAEGKRLDEMRPAEAVARDQRFEAVFETSPHPPRVG